MQTLHALFSQVAYNEQSVGLHCRAYDTLRSASVTVSAAPTQMYFLTYLLMNTYDVYNGHYSMLRE